MRHSLSTLRLGLVAAATCLAAGCSAFGSSSAASAPASTPAATASATPLGGPQLARLLFPVKGYKLNPDATRNTGSELPADTPQPVPASQVCQVLMQTSFIRDAGINTGDWASNDYISTDQSQEVAQEVDIFTGGDAQKAMTALWQAFGKCASFSSQSNGTTAHYTLTRSRLTGVGDGAIKAVIVSPAFDGGQTLVALRVGSQIITTDDSSSGKDLGSPAVGYAEQIAKRLRAAG